MRVVFVHGACHFALAAAGTIPWTAPEVLRGVRALEAQWGLTV